MSVGRGCPLKTPEVERIHGPEAPWEARAMPVLWTDRRCSRRERTRGHRGFHSCVERLEGRSMLTGGAGATIVLSNGKIEILGTNLGDTGSVSVQNGSVLVKISNSQGSQNVAFPLSQVSSIYYQGGTGNNVFTNATSLAGYLYGGSGNNVLNGGSGLDYLVATGNGTEVLNAGSGTEILESFGDGTNTLNGGSGYDTLIVYAGHNRVIGGTGSTCILAYGGQNYIDGGPGGSVVYSFSATDVIVPEAHETVHHIGY